MSKQRRRNSLHGKVNANREQRARRGFGYLNLPKDVPALSFKDKVTTVYLDFIPYEVTDPNHPDRSEENEIALVGDLWYNRPFKVHRDVGANNDKVVCPTSFGKPCPICEYVREKQNKGATWEDVEDIAAKSRNLFAVIPIDSEEHDEIPHIWDMSAYYMMREIDEYTKENPDDDGFADLENGKTCDMQLRWKTYGKSSYPEPRIRKFIKRDPYDESIVDEVPSLDDVLKVHSYEQLEEMFYAMEEAPDPDAGYVDEEPEERPTRRRQQREEPEEEPEEEKPTRRRRPPKEEPEEEPEEEKPTRRRRPPKEEPEEEPEEEKPTRRRRPPKEEPEEEKPTRSARRKPKEEPEADDDEKCPHGHKFGVDCEDFNECDTCELWDACYDEKNK